MTIDRRRFVQTLGGAAALAVTGIRSAHAQTAEFQLKWANNIPATHPSSIRVKEAAEKIKAETKGRVDIQVFPNNQLGGDTDMLSQVRSGAIDFFPLSGLILQTLVPLAAGLAIVVDRAVRHASSDQRHSYDLARIRTADEVIAKFRDNAARALPAAI